MPAPTFDAHRNLAVSSIAVAPSPPTSGTSITVGSGEGARFPAVPFNATIGQPAALLTPLNAEIVRVTAISGDVFTITRAQEGTAARSIAVGDLIGATITAKTITDLEGGFTGVVRTDLANTITADPQIITGATFARLILQDQSQATNQKNFSIGNTSGFAFIAATLDNFTGVYNPPALTIDRLGNLQIYKDISEKQRTTPMGHWIAVPFNATNFTTQAGTWTVAAGNVAVNRYTLIGKTVIWTCCITGSSVTGVTGGVYVALPLYPTTGLYLGGATKAYVSDGTGSIDNLISVSGTTNLAGVTFYGRNPNNGTFNLLFTLTYETN